MTEMADTRIMLKMVKKFNQIEQKESSVQEAELRFNILRDIEKERLIKYERQTRWILGMPGGSID